jgi:hypothetical protein
MRRLRSIALRRGWVISLLVLLGAALALLQSTPVRSEGESVATDQEIYGAGETVVVTGSGFAASASLIVRITDSSGAVVASDGVVADGAGGFTYEYVLPEAHIHGDHQVAILDESGMLLAETSFVGGSHFRFGHISWEPAGGNAIDFTVTLGYAWTSCGLPNVGDALACIEILQYGDSSSDAVTATVTAIDTTNNWVIGTASLSHTYASAGDFTAFLSSCCRIGSGTHVNNPDGAYRIQTVVNAGSGNSSPVSVLPPIVQCPIDDVCTFAVPAVDPESDTLSWRLSTDVEASGAMAGFTQPGPTDATNAASVNPTTGVYTWDTSGAALALSDPPTYYSSQVAIEDGTSTVVVDFLISLVQAVGTAPVFDSPTPSCDSTVGATIAAELTFTVEATDTDDGDTVTLNVIGLPSGAMVAPALPTTGNPVSSEFSWTPGAGDLGQHIVVFTAADDAAQTTLCILTLEVSEVEPTPAPEPEPTAPFIPEPDPDAFPQLGGTPIPLPTATPTEEPAPVETQPSGQVGGILPPNTGDAGLR